MSQPGQSNRNRPRPWRLWILAGLLLAVAAFHAPLLRGLARTLIADNGVRADDGGVRAGDELLVLSCQRSFDRAGELYRQGLASRLHYIEQPARRLVSMGVKPSWGALCVGQLTRRGVPAEAISPMGGVADGPWQDARVLQRWLNEDPDASVLVLCDRFSSGAIRFAFASVLEPGELKRVRFWCPADPRFDESNWWKSHDGRRELVVALFTQAYFRLHGEDAERPAAAFDPDAYERGLGVRG